MITERVKKSICALLACATTFSLIVPGPAKVSAASNVTVNLTAEKQVIRGFGGMNHPAWIGDLNICTKYEFCEKVPKKRPDDGPIFLFLFSHYFNHLSILLTAFLISSSVKCV